MGGWAAHKNARSIFYNPVNGKLDISMQNCGLITTIIGTLFVVLKKGNYVVAQRLNSYKMFRLSADIENNKL